MSKAIINDILGCATNPANWEGTLDQLNKTLKIASSCMTTVNEFENTQSILVLSKLFREELSSSDFNSVLSDSYKADQKLYNAMGQCATQKLFSEHKLLGVKRREDLPPSASHDLTSKMGVNIRLGATLNKSGPWIDTLFCQLTNTNAATALLSDSRMEYILPVLANSVSLSRTLNALKTKYNAILSVLDMLGVGVFLVSTEGDIIEHNLEASIILEQKDGLAITKSKRFSVRNAQQETCLEAMISQANGLFKGEIGSLSDLLNISRPSGAFDYLISVTALVDSQAELEKGFNCSFVMVIDPARKSILSADGISALCDLTHSETAIVKLMIEGCRPAEVAERRNVSSNTVKTQIKSIFSKTRCSSQSDIIRIAAATQMPMKN